MSQKVSSPFRIEALERNCAEDDSKKLAEAVEASAFQDLHRQPYQNEKNHYEWPSFGAYLLWFAGTRGAVACVEVLLHVVEVDARDKNQYTVLHHAAVGDRSEIARLFISAGGDVNAKDSIGESPIHKAAVHGKVQTLSVLCGETGADLNVQDNIGQTPLYWAVYKHDTESVRVLLHFGASADISDMRHETPRECAVRKKFQDIVDLMVTAAGPAEEVTTHASSQAQSDSAALELSIVNGDAYLRAIRRGGIANVRTLRFIVYGDADTGKTSLCRALKNLPHQASQSSTECVELSSVVCVVEAGNPAWQVLQGSDEVQRYIQQMVVGYDPGHTTAAAVDAVAAAPEPTALSTREPSPGTTASSATTSSGGRLSSVSSGLSSLLRDIVSRVTSASSVTGIAQQLSAGTFSLVRICDMAGQDTYRTMQDVLICRAFTAYAVVIDASEPVTSPCPPAYMRRAEQKNSVSVAILGQSRLDYLLDCLERLRGVVEAAKCTVYIVGTKIDLRQGDRQAVEDAVSADSTAIQKRIRSAELESLVQPENIFFVDNTRETGWGDQSLRSLRERIGADSSQLVKIPVKWLLFTLAVIDLAKHCQSPWVSRKDALELALLLGSIDRPEDISELLEFQHAIGYVLYYRSAPKYVVVKVDLVLRGISALMIPDGTALFDTFLDSTRPTWDEAELYQRGVLTTELATKIWRNSTDDTVRSLLGGGAECSANRTAIYELMEAMYITCNIGVQEMPSSGESQSVMFLPCVADQVTSVDRSGYLHPRIAFVTASGRYFQLSLMIKIATKCLCKFNVSFDSMFDLMSVQMKKTVFRLPWSCHDSCGTFLILSYFRTGLLLQIQSVSRAHSQQAVVDGQADAKNAISFVKLALLELLPTVQMLETAICPCDEPAADCTLHEKRACDGQGCFHVLRAFAQGSIPICPVSKKRQSIEPAALSCLGWQQNNAYRLEKVETSASEQDSAAVARPHQVPAPDLRPRAKRRCSAPSTDTAAIQRERIVSTSHPTSNLSSPTLRPTDPWTDERYVGTTYDLQTRLTEISEVRGLCFSHQLIDRGTRGRLKHIVIESDHNEELLAKLEATGNGVSFGKFREIIRHFSQQRGGVFDDILQVWDSIHPPPEEYLDLKESLERSP